MENKGKFSPAGQQHKRRHSYVAAMEDDNAIIEAEELIRRQSLESRFSTQKKKLTETISYQSVNSENSRCSTPALRKTFNLTKLPLSICELSSLSDDELAEILNANPEITFSLVRSLINKNNKSCECLNCRKNSLSSDKNYSNCDSRSHESSLSLPSSLCQYQKKSSDSLMSKTSPSDFEDRHSTLTTVSRPGSGTKTTEEKLKPVDDEKFKNSKERRNSSRRGSEMSVKSLRRDSIEPSVSKIMRRRFSEQLILEGGFAECEPEFEQLVAPEQDDDPDDPDAINARKKITLQSHYYPEGHWGYAIITVGVIIQLLNHGLQVGSGVLLSPTVKEFNESAINAGWLGAMSTGVALLISPVTIGICRRKSTRVTAVLGGLVTALGCLFTSFATQFHQLFFSYGAIVGVGVGITRDCSTLMVAQYFKRKREFVEIFIVSGSGLGIAIMSAFIKTIIGKIGWRLGLQAVTVTVFSTFFLGTFYRSASLYHPQRRAILHLKTQKRKIKEKNKVDDRPPILDFATLRSKTVRILLLSTGISAFGINTPIFYLAHQIEEEGLGDMVILLQAYLGLGWTVGCVTFGLLVIRQNVECRIARQYLMQTAIFICGICILALTTVHGNYYGYVMFTWIYGIFCGGYHYSLKMYTYERVRARNFVRTWGFVQCSQAIPIAIGVPISGYINISFGNKAGYYFSSTCVLVGSFTLFFIDLHKRNLSKHRSGKSNGIKHTCNSNCQKKRGLSFNQEAENDNTPGASAMGFNPNAEHPPALGEAINKLSVDKPELTCISEEGIADMDLPDNILDDIEYIGDCITSCNKVENYLMLSEFENNLIAEMPIIMDRKGRKWSLARSKSIHGNPPAGPSTSQTLLDEDDIKSKWLLMPAPINNRAITVIEEASTSQVES